MGSLSKACVSDRLQYSCAGLSWGCTVGCGRETPLLHSLPVEISQIRTFFHERGPREWLQPYCILCLKWSAYEGQYAWMKCNMHERILHIAFNRGRQNARRAGRTPTLKSLPTAYLRPPPSPRMQPGNLKDKIFFPKCFSYGSSLDLEAITPKNVSCHRKTWQI